MVTKDVMGPETDVATEMNVKNDAGIDKDFSREVWCLLGLPFDAINMDVLMIEIKSAVKDQRSCILSTPNLNILVASCSDENYRQSLINSELSIVDGMPLVWMAFLLGMPLRERVAGSSLIEKLVESDNNSPFTVFFFGGEEGSGKKAHENMNRLDGGLKSVGWLNPGFCSLDEMNSNVIIEKINDSYADLLIVSVGAKKGQAWIERNRDRLNVFVLGPLGAVINFYAGTIMRAPVWMQRIGLEWLWRIKEEPVLWKRYFKDGIGFLKLIAFNVLPYFLWIKRNRKQFSENKVLDIKVQNNTDRVDHSRVMLVGACTGKTIEPLRKVFKDLVLKGNNVVIDLKDVALIDGAFIGLCFILKKHLDQRGLHFKLENPIRPVQRIFKWSLAEQLLD